MQQRDRFDYVLIETTGLANPGPVAAALWTDEQLESRWGRALGGNIIAGHGLQVLPSRGYLSMQPFHHHWSARPVHAPTRRFQPLPSCPCTKLPRSICLDCIVTVVDARHIRRQLADPRPDGGVNEAQQQVAFADVVLLNKVRARRTCCRGCWDAGV